MAKYFDQLLFWIVCCPLVLLFLPPNGSITRPGHLDGANTADRTRTAIWSRSKSRSRGRSTIRSRFRSRSRGGSTIRSRIRNRSKLRNTINRRTEYYQKSNKE